MGMIAVIRSGGKKADVNSGFPNSAQENGKSSKGRLNMLMPSKSDESLLEDSLGT